MMFRVVRMFVKFINETIEEGMGRSGHWNAHTAHASVINNNNNKFIRPVTLRYGVLHAI